MRSFLPNLWGADHGDWAPFLLHEFFEATSITRLSGRVASILDLGPCALAWVGFFCGPSCFIGSVPQLPS